MACFSTICKLGPFSEVVLGFLQPGMWRKAHTTSVLVPNCYKTVHKLLSNRAVCFYNRLRTFFRQPSQVYLETSFSWEIFSLQHQGLLRTRVTEYSSWCFIPWKSAFIQLRQFPCFGALKGINFFSSKFSLQRGVDSKTLRVPGLEGGFILGPEGSRVLFHWSLHSSFSPSFPLDSEEVFSILEPKAA